MSRPKRAAAIGGHGKKHLDVSIFQLRERSHYQQLFINPCSIVCKTACDCFGKGTYFLQVHGMGGREERFGEQLSTI